jgi:hypothetical protein
MTLTVVTDFLESYYLWHKKRRMVREWSTTGSVLVFLAKTKWSSWLGGFQLFMIFTHNGALHVYHDISIEPYWLGLDLFTRLCFVSPRRRRHTDTTIEAAFPFIRKRNRKHDHSYIHSSIDPIVSQCRSITSMSFQSCPSFPFRNRASLQGIARGTLRALSMCAIPP